MPSVSYLSDIIFIRCSISDTKYVTQYLDKVFKVKDMGSLKYYFVLKSLERVKKFMCIGNDAFDILIDTDILDTKQCSTLVAKD